MINVVNELRDKLYIAIDRGNKREILRASRELDREIIKFFKACRLKNEKSRGKNTVK